MINKIEIEGIIKSIDSKFSYFMIKSRYVNFSGTEFWSLLKVSLFADTFKQLLKDRLASPGELVKVVGALKININKNNQLIPTIIPTEIKIY